jgi:hypothetical protein
LTGITLTVTLSPTRHDTEDGTYYSLGGSVQAWPGRPIQPHAAIPLTEVADRSPRGQLLITAIYTDILGFDPVVASPITDTDLPEPTFSAIGWHPAEFWAINRFGAQARSTLLGGQFNAEGLTERLYGGMVLETFYTDDTSDSQAPVIWSILSEVGQGNVVTFAVGVTNAVRVLVTYDLPNGDGTGTLQSIDLEQSADPSLWTASVAGLSADTEYLVQVMDSAGNVAIGSKDAFHLVGAVRPDAINPIGTPHTLDLELAVDGGNCADPVPGEPKLFLAGVGSYVADESCEDPGSSTCRVTITSEVAGISTLTIQWDTDWTTASYEFVKVWWAGSISLPKRVELGPFTAEAQVCFTLSRTDGPLYTSSDVEQCFTAQPGSSDHIFQWQELTEGTYNLSEIIVYTTTVPGTGTVTHSVAYPDLITDIAVDDGNQNVLLPTIENRLPPAELLIEKRDEFGFPWTGNSPVVTFEIYDCGADLDCASLEGLAAMVEISWDENPASVTLGEGRYLVREVAPLGYVAQGDEQEVTVIIGQGASVLFTNLGTEGCTPGYWKNHTERWDEIKDDSFNDTFGVSQKDRTSPFKDRMTLEDAINLGGGGHDKLARHGVAALLNAQNGVGYPYADATVIFMVQSGLAGDGEPYATWLVDANELGCSLN